MRESDIRSLKGIRDESHSEGRWLAQFRDDNGNIRDEFTFSRECPCCASRRSEFFNRYNGFQLVRCDECTTIYVNPSFKDQYLSRFYSDPESRGDYDKNILESGAAPKARLEGIFSPRKELILNSLGQISADRKVSLLDIGCASGQFLSLFSELDQFELSGIDANSSSVLQAKSLYPAINWIDSPFETYSFSDHSYDGITLWEVLEHLNNPLQNLKKIRLFQVASVLNFLKF